MAITRISLAIDTSPGHALQPNQAYRKGGTFPRSEEAGRLRTYCAEKFKQQLEPIAGRRRGPGTFFLGPVRVATQIFWEREVQAGAKRARIAQRRAVDTDGAISMLKPMYDALQDCLVVLNDSQIIDFSVTQDASNDGLAAMIVTISILGASDLRTKCHACDALLIPATVEDRVVAGWCPRCKDVRRLGAKSQEVFDGWRM